jgi:hypothetical protein
LQNALCFNGEQGNLPAVICPLSVQELYFLQKDFLWVFSSPVSGHSVVMLLLFPFLFCFKRFTVDEEKLANLNKEKQ